jgi:four helix bundle protein
VWQKSHALALLVYRSSSGLPKSELFGLTSQMRRAAISVPANIAEAFGRSTRPEKARLLNIAQGSLDELRYYLLLSKDLGYSTDPGLAEAAEEVGRMLDAYRRRIVSTG